MVLLDKQIKRKFNKGDICYYFHRGEPQKFKITSCTPVFNGVTRKHIKWEYGIEHNKYSRLGMSISGNLLFKDIEDIIDWLKRTFYVNNQAQIR